MGEAEPAVAAKVTRTGKLKVLGCIGAAVGATVFVFVGLVLPVITKIHEHG